MQIEDPLRLLTGPAVARAARAARLPLPQSVRYLGRHGCSARYAIQFEPSAQREPMVLHLDLGTGVRGHALQREAAALSAVEHHGGIRVPSGFSVLGSESLGHVAAFRTPLPAEGGAARIERNPAASADVARILAETWTALEDLPFPWFGLRADDGSFLPSRATWRDEWTAYVVALRRRTRHSGVVLGAATQRAFEAIDQDLPSLDAVGEFRLVHGRLFADAVAFGADGHPIVISWQEALVGDGLVEASPLFALTEGPLGELLHALGRADEWMAPDALARIRVYHLTWVLQQAVSIGELAAVDKSLVEMARLERVSRHLRDALDPGFIRGRIEGVLASRGPQARRETLDPTRSRLRVTLAMFASDPPIPGSASLELACHLAAALLLGSLASDDPNRDRLVASAMPRAANRVPGSRPDAQEVPDIRAWRSALARQVLAATSRGGPAETPPLVALWTGLEALAAVDHEVAPGTLRGFEQHLRASLSKKVDASAHLGDRYVLASALLGLGAAAALARMEPAVAMAAETCAEGFRATLREAGLDPDSYSMAVEERAEWLGTALGAVPTEPVARALHPLLVYAMLQLGGRSLPGSPIWLLRNTVLS